MAKQPVHKSFWKRAAALFTAFLLILTGAAIGMALAQAERIIAWGPTVLAILGAIAAAALLIVVILLALRQWLVVSAEDRRQELADAAASLVRAVREAEPEKASEALTELKGHAPTILKTLTLGWAYWRTIAALGGIMGAAVITAQFVVNVQQSERLAEQNVLLRAQNAIAAQQRRAELQQQEAERRYDEIARILDESTSAAAQEYALLTLPDAMVMEVEIIDPAWRPKSESDIPDTILIYPNLKPLAQRLLAFIKQPRIVEKDAEGKEAPSATVSTAICRCLHRLGYGEKPDAAVTYGTAVWDAVFDEEGRIRTRPTHAGRLTQRLHDDPYLPGGKWTPCDLRHMKPRQLVGASLQGADLQTACLQGAKLCQASLQGVQLQSAFLQGVDLEEARLQGANLTMASLQGANLTMASLQGVQLQSAFLHGASLLEASLQGANLDGARLQGVDLGLARLQGASLNGASLIGASLSMASLQGANLDWASLSGASLRGASLQGAWLFRTSLRGADLTDASLQGAELSGADFAAGAVGLVAVAVQHVHWRWPRSGDAPDDVAEIAMPAALLERVRIGRGYGVSRRHLFLHDVNQALAMGSLTTVFWDTREEAEAALRASIGEKAVDWIVERSTFFEGSDYDAVYLVANLTGVFIDEETLKTMKSDDCVPPCDDVFKHAITDSAKINERHGWTMPDPAEAVRQRAATKQKPEMLPAQDSRPK